MERVGRVDRGCTMDLGFQKLARGSPVPAPVSTCCHDKCPGVTSENVSLTVVETSRREHGDVLTKRSGEVLPWRVMGIEYE